MVKAIMHGCNGHMGRVITDICSKDDNIEIVAGIDPYDGVPNDYPVFTSIDKCDVKADVIIDFSNELFKNKTFGIALALILNLVFIFL